MRKKLVVLAAMLAMVMSTAVPAFAQDATIGDTIDNSTSVDSRNLVLQGDNGQAAARNSVQLLDQDVTQVQQNTVDGGSGDVAIGGQDVSAEQTQYNANLLFGGYYWYYPLCF